MRDVLVLLFSLVSAVRSFAVDGSVLPLTTVSRVCEGCKKPVEKHQAISLPCSLANVKLFVVFYP